ncbi:MAG: CoA transferase, partial [Alphaproteobacteria bacterium]|nr:CoA transferase [Alphaproteobacteria bacterium]
MTTPTASPTTPAAPLAGLRVLDLTRILAGPWATQNLADLGAEVIKIEHPNGGDDTRQMGPPFVRDQHSGELVDAAYFLAANRGKQSVAIDIAT